MDAMSKVASENGQLRSKAERRDQALRVQWALLRSIPAIARVMDVNPAWVRRRAMRIGLPARPRAVIVHGM
jgi:hypothetical protein